MIDTVKPRPLLEAEKDAIIKTNYGLRKIPPCFGYMRIDNPYDLQSEKFHTPDEMQVVKRKLTLEVRDLLDRAEMCNTCHLFKSCVPVSTLNLHRTKVQMKEEG